MRKFAEFCPSTPSPLTRIVVCSLVRKIGVHCLNCMYHKREFDLEIQDKNTFDSPGSGNILLKIIQIKLKIFDGDSKVYSWRQVKTRARVNKNTRNA